MSNVTLRPLALLFVLTACGGPNDPELSSSEDQARAAAQTPTRYHRTGSRPTAGAASRKIVEMRQCWMDFSNWYAIALLPDNAGLTFAVDPYWKQPCYSGTVARLVSTNMSHFHLLYDDPNINCFPSSNRMGRLDENGNCVEANPFTEPRHVSGHIASHRLSLFVERNEQRRPFNLDGITVLNDVPILVRFLPAGASTWQSITLQGGAHSIPTQVNNVVEVEFVSVNAPNGPVIAFDDLVLDVPISD